MQVLSPTDYKTVANKCPKYQLETDKSAKIITVPPPARNLRNWSALDVWFEGQDRLPGKVKKIFEGANVDKVYSIMDPIEVSCFISLKKEIMLEVSKTRESVKNALRRQIEHLSA
jgi:hypothetical protein